MLKGSRTKDLENPLPIQITEGENTKGKAKQPLDKISVGHLSQ